MRMRIFKSSFGECALMRDLPSRCALRQLAFDYSTITPANLAAFFSALSKVARGKERRMANSR